MFDEKSFNEFTEKLSVSKKLSDGMPEEFSEIMKASFIAGWLSGMMATEKVYAEYKANGEKMQSAYEKVLAEDWKKFQNETSEYK